MSQAKSGPAPYACFLLECEDAGKDEVAHKTYPIANGVGYGFIDVFDQQEVDAVMNGCGDNTDDAKSDYLAQGHSYPPSLQCVTPDKHGMPLKV